MLLWIALSGSIVFLRCYRAEWLRSWSYGLAALCSDRASTSKEFFLFRMPALSSAVCYRWNSYTDVRFIATSFHSFVLGSNMNVSLDSYVTSFRPPKRNILSAYTLKE